MGVTAELCTLFDRDLDGLIAELELFVSQADLWRVTAGVSNAAGNLALHIVGNLNHYVGAGLGATNYLRDRPAEFASRGISRDELISRVSDTKTMLTAMLSELDAAQLEQIYPEEVLGYTMTTRYFLMHLYGHLSYHLGQVNYLRRVLHG